MPSNTFEKWQDVLTHVGKEIGFRVVESPDVKGRLVGIDFNVNPKTGEIEEVFLRLHNSYETFEFWKCYPVTDRYKVYTPSLGTNELSPFKGETLWEQGVVYAPCIPVANATSVNGEIVWYRNKWKNLWLRFKRLFYKSKNYKAHMKYLNRKVDTKFYGTINITKEK